MRKIIHSVGMLADPEHEDLHDFSDLIFREGMSGRDPVPFPQTIPAAASRGVLCDETGMSAHRGLFPVVVRLCGGETLFDERAALQFHSFESVFRKNAQFLLPQSETGSEFGPCKSVFQNPPVVRSHETLLKSKRTGPQDAEPVLKNNTGTGYFVLRSKRARILAPVISAI